MSKEESKLSHIDQSGRASMVDVGEKQVSQREAKAMAFVEMKAETLALIQEGGMPKGDVLAVARIAGIQAAKNTANLIPLCHPLMLTKIDLSFTIDEVNSRVLVESCCGLSGKTGVEMEALTAVSIAALTIYDMCKAVDKGIVIGKVSLMEKTGGKSGAWINDENKN